MGIYLNPRNRGFLESIRSEIYVDKTGLITETNNCINTEQKFICVSRPRRFGKSMALKMLSAYYSIGSDSRELFTGLKIESDESFSKHLNHYDVIYLNMQQFLIEAAPGKVTEYLEQEVVEELAEEYGEILQRRDMGLAAALRKIYVKTDKQFIFLIDEGTAGVGNAAETVSGFPEESFKRPAVCRPCLHDRHSARKKVWPAFSIEYVLGIFHDRPVCS